jgi:hypothetical protein
MISQNQKNPFSPRLEKDLASKIKYQEIEALHLKLLFSPEEEPIKNIIEFQRLTDFYFINYFLQTNAEKRSLLRSTRKIFNDYMGGRYYDDII